ncbi:MAG: HAD-IA family hydrolase [Pseudomonadota bacterium]
MDEQRANEPVLTEGDLEGVAVLFDLDGTLIDTAGDLAAATNHVLAAAGRPSLSTEIMRKFVGFGARAMIKAGFEATGAPAAEADLDTYVSDFLDYYLAHIDDFSKPFPGAVDAIGVLRAAGAKIGICTNKREGPTRQLIEKLALTNLFDAIVGGDTAAAPKPDPAPVHLCLRGTGAMSGVFVGDSDTDIRAAAAANMPVIVVDFGYGPIDLADPSKPLLSSYNGLPRAIAQTLSIAPSDTS